MNLSNDRFIYVVAIIIVVINSLSFLQNLLALVVFSQKAFAKSSFRIYFKSLAVFDMFVIFYVISGSLSLVYDQDLFNGSDFVCKAVYFVSIGLSPNSGWVLVLFSLDQLNRVTMSKRCLFIRQRKFQFALFLALFIFHVLNSLYVITQVQVKEINGAVVATSGFNLTTTTFQKRCDYPTAISFMPVFYMLESCVIPLVVMIVTTTLILKVLYQSRAALGKYSPNAATAAAAALNNKQDEEEDGDDEDEAKVESRENETNGSKNISAVDSCKDAASKPLRNLAKSTCPPNQKKTVKSNSSSSSQILSMAVNVNVNVNLKKNRNLKFAFNSVVFNIVFIVMASPLVVVHLYKNNDNFVRLRYALFVMMSLNYASHFWIHFFVNAIFRKQLLELLSNIYT